MSGAIQDVIPQAEVWHLGFYRDESTLQPVEYYQKFSDSAPAIASSTRCSHALPPASSVVIAVDRTVPLNSYWLVAGFPVLFLP
jgi:hypothetical protein